jgi:hypothetical protein
MADRMWLLMRDLEEELAARTSELEEARRDAERAERRGMEKAAEICRVRISYPMPIPCPDGIAGCCVAHFVAATRGKTGTECADAIDAASAARKAEPGEARGSFVCKHEFRAVGCSGGASAMQCVKCLRWQHQI